MLQTLALAVSLGLAAVHAAPAAALAPRWPGCVDDYPEFTFVGYTIGKPEKNETYLRLLAGQLFDNLGNQVVSVLGNLELLDGNKTMPQGVDEGTFEMCTESAGEELYFVPTVGDHTPLKYCTGIVPDGYVSVLLPEAPAVGYSCQVGGVETLLYTGPLTEVPDVCEIGFPLLLKPEGEVYKQTYDHHSRVKRDFVEGLAMNFAPRDVSTVRRGESPLPKIALGTMFRNSRKFMFEWIEFYRLLGVQHFLLYDNESEDSPREFLQPYIEAGIVEMISWPPKDISSVAAPSALASDVKTKAQNKFLNKALKACWGQEWQTHKQGPCQFAASVDMLRRAEGKYDWLGFLDIDEFVYPAKLAGVSSLPALFGTVQPFASADYIGISGSNFGTSGHVKFPRAISGDSLPPLVTANYFLRRSIDAEDQTPFVEGVNEFLEKSSVSGSLPQSFAVPATFARKAFVRPSVAAYSIVHDWIMSPDAGEINRVDVSLEYPQLKMNHYAYLSQEDATEKARMNGNPLASFNQEQDNYYSQELDLAIEYLLEALRRRMQTTKAALGLKL